jgi:hypothetical protein
MGFDLAPGNTGPERTAAERAVHGILDSLALKLKRRGGQSEHLGARGGIGAEQDAPPTNPRNDAMATTEHWKNEPDDHDYPAARDYLSLILPDATSESLSHALERAALIHRQAKDLLRASGLVALPDTNVHVASDLKKVKKGDKLSPVLLVRGHAETGMPLIIADGYHRVCASYHLDEDADIPCRMVDLPPT